MFFGVRWNAVGCGTLKLFQRLRHHWRTNLREICHGQTTSHLNNLKLQRQPPAMRNRCAREQLPPCTWRPWVRPHTEIFFIQEIFPLRTITTSHGMLDYKSQKKPQNSSFLLRKLETDLFQFSTSIMLSSFLTMQISNHPQFSGTPQFSNRVQNTPVFYYLSVFLINPVFYFLCGYVWNPFNKFVLVSRSRYYWNFLLIVFGK